MTKVGLPFPEVLLVVSAILEIVAALAIIAGWNYALGYGGAGPVDDPGHLGVPQSRGRPGTDGPLHEERRHHGRAPLAVGARPGRLEPQALRLGGTAPVSRLRRPKKKASAPLSL